MRRFYAVVIGVAMLLVTAGHASAEPFTRSTAHQQAIDYVIARALAQRGVPFVYGGGDATGPTSKAARTFSVWREWAAQAATSRQPRLCAASVTGAGAASSSSSSRACQSPLSGRSQSCCSTR